MHCSSHRMIWSFIAKSFLFKERYKYRSLFYKSFPLVQVHDSSCPDDATAASMISNQTSLERGRYPQTWNRKTVWQSTGSQLMMVICADLCCMPPSLHFRLSDPAALPSSAQLQMLPENLRTKLRFTQPNGRNKTYPLLQTSSCQILAAQCVVVSTLKILSKSTVRWLMTGVVPCIATSKEHAEASVCSSVTFSFPPSLCRSDPTWLL